MVELLRKWSWAFAAVALVASTASAQVVIGPGNQSGRPGSDVEFRFSIDGSTMVSAFGFNILYAAATAPYAPVLVAGTTDTVDCTVESDLAASVSPLVFSLTDQGILAVSFGDFDFPVTVFGRTGLIARCTFHIKADATPGIVPLACDPSPAATTAADAQGADLPATCQDGTLTILPFLTCCGDTDGSGSVSASEATTAVLAFGRRDTSLNPAADCNGDGMVSSSEATRIVLNFGRRECAF